MRAAGVILCINVGAYLGSPVTTSGWGIQRVQSSCWKKHYKFSKSIPIGRPVTPYYQGWYEWLTGKQNAALKSWHKGLEAAQKFNMPYEEGLLRLKLGSHGSTESRKEHLERAIQIFEKMGAAYELRLATAEASAAHT